jgi:hypothetical protein
MSGASFPNSAESQAAATFSSLNAGRITAKVSSSYTDNHCHQIMTIENSGPFSFIPGGKKGKGF